MINPPPAEMLPLSQAIKSPIKKKVSVAGRVVQQDETYQVPVRGQQVPIRHIYLDDGSMSKCKVTLWRDLANQSLQPGDYIEVTNVVVNSFKNETSLSTTPVTSLKKSEIPVQKQKIVVQGISTSEDLVEILLEDETVVACEKVKVLSALPDDTDLENLTAEGNVLFQVERRGGEILSIEKCNTEN